MSVKQWLVARFESWLDEAMGTESEPAGLAAEILEEARREAQAPGDGSLDAAIDQFGFLSAVAGLSHQIKLQGRSFQELGGSVGSLGSLAPLVEESVRRQEEGNAILERVVAQSHRLRDDARDRAIREARRSGQREMLEALLETRDRLDRGLSVARARSAPADRPGARGWWARLWSGPGAPGGQGSADGQAVEALIDGYRMGLDRLDEVLGRLGLREIEARGRPFDPVRMVAMDVTWVMDSGQDGSVIEVCRPGWAWQDEVVRPAQVIVGRLRPGQAGDPARSAREDDARRA